MTLQDFAPTPTTPGTGTVVVTEVPQSEWSEFLDDLLGLGSDIINRQRTGGSGIPPTMERGTGGPGGGDGSAWALLLVIVIVLVVMD
jgi:hypothetical protein